MGFVVDGVGNIPAEDKVGGYAKFVSDTVLRVDDHTEIQASRVVIATGSRPSVPPPFRALGDRLVVNDDVFAWEGHFKAEAFPQAEPGSRGAARGSDS